MISPDEYGTFIKRKYMKLSAEDIAMVKEYGCLFVSTGGNDIVELIERDGVTYFNNAIVAELQGCCYSQLQLLKSLKKEGRLLEGRKS
jgi:hypothetical protein